ETAGLPQDLLRLGDQATDDVGARGETVDQSRRLPEVELAAFGVVLLCRPGDAGRDLGPAPTQLVLAARPLRDQQVPSGAVEGARPDGAVGNVGDLGQLGVVSVALQDRS